MLGVEHTVRHMPKSYLSADSWRNCKISQGVARKISGMRSLILAEQRGDEGAESMYSSIIILRQGILIYKIYNPNSARKQSQQREKQPKIDPCRVLSFYTVWVYSDAIVCTLRQQKLRYVSYDPMQRCVGLTTMTISGEKAKQKFWCQGDCGIVSIWRLL